MRNQSELTRFIKSEAQEIGFDLVGIAPALPFPETELRLLDHIEKGRIAGLAWFTSERASFSSDPVNLLPEVRSLISVGMSYLSKEPEKLGDAPTGRIARYAWGQNYHTVLKKMMGRLFERIKEYLGESALPSRLVLDTARIVDRAVGQRAGLGFFGKNTNLINKTYGSWIFLAEILTDLELDYDPPSWGNCGHCTRCIEVCPTGAIVEPWAVVNDRCISYLTIELEGLIPEELRAGMGKWVFGCDLCQEVCPYNKRALITNHPEFQPPDSFDTQPDLLEWLRLTETEPLFREKFRGSPLLRPKRAGLRRNIAIALGNSPSRAAVAPLSQALRHEPDQLVRTHLVWALGQIGGMEAKQELEQAWVQETSEIVRVALQKAFES
ncbi:MAG: tRNA epoxyqueuosine(34) reductase QueG [Chloroflexota bacterium]|nr:tRNA epoxyqueuosine(34) reductase QueG [Chloroflexota bacterium]